MLLLEEKVSEVSEVSFFDSLLKRDDRFLYKLEFIQKNDIYFFFSTHSTVYIYVPYIKFYYLVENYIFQVSKKK